MKFRVYLESEEHGREYFNHYNTIEECHAAVERLVSESQQYGAKDHITRRIGIELYLN